MRAIRTKYLLYDAINLLTMIAAIVMRDWLILDWNEFLLAIKE